MRLSRVTKESLLKSLDWREELPESVRTSYYLTEHDQEKFFEKLSTDSTIRYFNVLNDDKVSIGTCGFVNISSENRIAEISISIDPEYRGQGLGKKTIDLLIDHGFNKMNLKTIFGECYYCNPALVFWEKIVEKYGAYKTHLPNRKFFNGEYFASLYFSINKNFYSKKES